MVPQAPVDPGGRAARQAARWGHHDDLPGHDLGLAVDALERRDQLGRRSLRCHGKDPEPILERPYPLDEPQLSPDGRWLAYGAHEGTRWWEVYIEPYGRPGQRVRVSPEGGGQPKWRGDGKELFYVTRGGRLMAVEVRASSDRLDVGLPVRLFGGVLGNGTIDTYAVTRDGQRFLVIAPLDSAARGKIHVVTNWTSLLSTGKPPAP